MLTKEEKVALFEAWVEARRECWLAESRASVRAKAIYERMGNGPFRWEGMLWEIRTSGVGMNHRFTLERID